MILVSLQGPEGKEGFAGSHGLPVRCPTLLYSCVTLFNIMIIDAYLTSADILLQGIPGLQGPLGPSGEPGCNGTDVRKYYTLTVLWLHVFSVMVLCIIWVSQTNINQSLHLLNTLHTFRVTMDILVFPGTMALMDIQ